MQSARGRRPRRDVSAEFAARFRQVPDPLPEAGLRKAKRKYRNECVENLHRPRRVGGREWGVEGPILHLSQSGLDLTPHAELTCRGAWGPGLGGRVVSWSSLGCGVSTAPCPPFLRCSFSGRRRTLGQGWVFLRLSGIWIVKGLALDRHICV